MTFVVAEELTAAPDEGYAAFVRALESKLACGRPTLLHVMPPPRWLTPPFLVLSRVWHVVRAARRPELGTAGPALIVYIPRCSLTLPALFLGRVWKRLCGDAPLVLVALQAFEGGRRPGPVHRLLAPDLLVVPTQRGVDQARAEGLNAEALWTGANLRRLHPPSAEEGEQLPSKWPLPFGDQVIPHVGHLREGHNPYSRDAIVGRLINLLDEVQSDREASAGRAQRAALITARLRRIAVEGKALPRRLMWSRNLGYQPRQPATAQIVPVEDPAPLIVFNQPDTDVVAISRPSREVNRSTLALTADFLGLGVRRSMERGAVKGLNTAGGDRPMLFTGRLHALPRLPSEGRESLAAFVNRGGTLYIDGLTAESAGMLRELGDQLRFEPPGIRVTSPACHLTFSANHSAFARELAGTRLRTTCPGYAFTVTPEEDVLAHASIDDDISPAVVQRHVGSGRVVLSVLPDLAVDRLPDAVISDETGGVAVALLLLRETYGSACWHAPAPLANFTIDDPALRQGMLGLRYDILVAQARDHGFHVTIATVPRELDLAEEAVTSRLREQPDFISACYHGCDHSSYEFYLTHGSRTAYAPRPLEEQRRSLWRALDHGRRFARAHRHELDRVMVFPYGVGPASIFPDLHRVGFLATCNYGDKFPLEAPTPSDADLGLRPADLAWEGFPLLWRRGLGDQGYLLDLMLGRPILIFSHRRELGRDFKPFVERAQIINGASRGSTRWGSLDEVARHAYLQRNDPDSGWEVMMTANEACLHNPDPTPRTYVIKRPNVPAGAAFFVNGHSSRDDELPRVTVPPGKTVVVRLVTGSSVSALPARYGCTVFAPHVKEARSEERQQ